MGYKVTEKGLDALEVIKAFEEFSEPELDEYLRDVELGYETIKDHFPLIEHRLPDILAGMVADGLLGYEPD